MVCPTILAPNNVADFEMCVGVWAFVQDYKFYNAEGGKRRQLWTHNNAFRDGAMRGYHSVQSASLETGDEKEIIHIPDDSESGQTSDDDEIIPMDIENWIRTTQANQASVQYFDPESKTWTHRQRTLSDDFLTELRDAAGSGDSNNPKTDGGISAGYNKDLPGSALQDRDMADETGFDSLEESSSVAEVSVVIPARNRSEEFRHLDELCADVMQMHGDNESSSARTEEQERDVDYEFCWTGMYESLI